MSSWDDEDDTLIGKTPDLPSRARRDHPCLIVLAGDGLGDMFLIEQPEVVIGRGADAAIRLRDESVSRRHARVVLGKGDARVEDLRSANGTRVNGESIDSAALRDGDKIQLGSTAVLKFTYVDELEENFQRWMQQAAVYDPLTKACNKRHFLQRLQTEVSYATRHRTPLCLLMLDVDHFKQVNDLCGHQAGDYVLAELGQIIASGVRAEDLVARYGGEEFAVLCRGTTFEGALVLAQRLRARVEHAAFEYKRREIPVTISVGVASMVYGADSANRLIADADQALYEAKHAGRNRVVAHAPKDA